MKCHHTFDPVHCAHCGEYVRIREETWWDRARTEAYAWALIVGSLVVFYVVWSVTP